MDASLLRLLGQTEASKDFSKSKMLFLNTEKQKSDPLRNLFVCHLNLGKYEDAFRVIHQAFQIDLGPSDVIGFQEIYSRHINFLEVADRERELKKICA